MSQNIIDLRDPKTTSNSEEGKKNNNSKKRLSKKQKIIIGIVVALIVVTGLAIWWYVTANQDDVVEEEKQPEEKRVVLDQSEDLRSPVNGMLLPRPQAGSRPFAVMIENMIDSRPHSGIYKADMVYEALVEGGITRFNVIFQNPDDSLEIGPVRSARAYYLDWAASELDAIYTHAGGSALALSLLNQFDLRRLNGIAGESRFFVRDGSRVAPHNLYTNGEVLKYAKRDYDWDNSILGEVGSWNFEDGKSENTEHQTITIDYSSPSYEAKFEYIPEENKYKRFTGGQPHADRNTGEEVMASTVIVQRVNAYLRDEKHLRMDTIGEGDAMIYANGVETLAKWKKETRTGRTMFYDKDTGEEITMTAGLIWVSVVKLDTGVTVE